MTQHPSKSPSSYHYQIGGIDLLIWGRHKYTIVHSYSQHCLLLVDYPALTSELEKYDLEFTRYHHTYMPWDPVITSGGVGWNFCEPYLDDLVCIKPDNGFCHGGHRQVSLSP